MKKTKTTTIQCKVMTGPPTRLRCGYFGAAAGLMLLMTAGPTWGQPSEVTKVLASDAAAGDEFGFTVSIDGDTAVVGAPFHDQLGSNSGSAYIFQQDPVDPDTWDEVMELLAGDAFAGDQFGTSVSISGDFAIVGARLNDDACPGDPSCNSGSAYIFYRNQGGTDIWGQVAKITASDAAAGDVFGTSVSISGGLAVIGATGVGSAVGAAYIFRRDGAGVWNEVAILTASDGAANDLFGTSVSISGDTAIVGASGDDDNGSLSGSAYIFDEDEPSDQNGWGEVEKLTASDGAMFDFFGGAVAISMDTAVVGAFGDGGFAGSAYIFERDAGGADQWGQTTKLTASDATGSDQFGISVSIRGEGVVVGAFGDDDDGFESGSAYLFREPSVGWQNATEDDKITAIDAAAGDEFAFFVSISGDRAIVGAHFNDDNGTSSGSAYIFDGVCPCPADFDGDCKVHVKDLLFLLGAWGPCGDCADCPADLVVDCDVDVKDLLVLLGDWGLCPCEEGPPPPSLDQVLADACVSDENWDKFVAKMTDPNASQEDKDRYDCWMRHYLFECNCMFCQSHNCPAPDPFND